MAGVILDIGPKERSVGLLYTGISRVKSLKTLAFESAPPDTMPSYERMTSYYNYQYMKEVREEDKRLKELEKKTMEEYEMHAMMGQMDIDTEPTNEPLATLQLMDTESELELELECVEDMDIE